MIFANVGDFKDFLKQDLALQCCRNQNQYFNWTHINQDQKHYKRNNLLGPHFFFPGDSHTKGLISFLNSGLEGVTEVDTDPKRGFVSFKVTPSSDRVLCVYVPTGHNTWEKLWESSLKDYKIIWNMKVRGMKTKWYLENLIVL